MQFIKVDKETKLRELSKNISSKDISNLLHLNSTPRVPNIGEAFSEVCRQAIANTKSVTWEQKKSILNTLTTDSDVFETVSLLGSSGWRLVSSDLNTIPGYMKVPDNVRLPQSVNMLGNSQKVTQKIYNKVMQGLDSDVHDIDPSIFSSPYYGQLAVIRQTSSSSSVRPMRFFKIPFGDVTLYSSLDGDSVDFPCYPEEMSDIVRANYGQMPDMLYQYEPWMVYTGSGPRANTYSFNIHRDMWDDHNNGKANELIRFCQAQCYPKYNGSAVHTSTVTLYIKGSPLIRGIVTDVSVHWDGPLGHDGFYLHFTIDITIQEISSTALNYDVMRTKKLIG